MAADVDDTVDKHNGQWWWKHNNALLRLNRLTYGSRSSTRMIIMIECSLIWKQEKEEAIFCELALRIGAFVLSLRAGMRSTYRIVVFDAPIKIFI